MRLQGRVLIPCLPFVLERNLLVCHVAFSSTLSSAFRLSKNRKARPALNHTESSLPQVYTRRHLCLSSTTQQ